jgi:hypothetical protein
MSSRGAFVWATFLTIMLVLAIVSLIHEAWAGLAFALAGLVLVVALLLYRIRQLRSK